MNSPETAYILLWFPKPSETFVFNEVINLREMGLPLKVFTLYGKLTRNLSPEMRSASNSVERLGIPYLTKIHADILFWWKRDRRLVYRVLRTFFIRRWRGLEKTGENFWAFLCAFRLARRFEEEGIEHIHAPWAGGPATAAWIASCLTGIPFSFTARAWDIYPPDSVLKEKIRDATLVRSEIINNISYLSEFANGNRDKIHLTYNSLTLNVSGEASVAMRPPYRLLALGRFVEKKGYDYLIMACKILKDSGLDFGLTLAGNGPKKRQLRRLTRRLDLDDCVSFPGFITHDRIPELFRAADIFLMPSMVTSSGDRDGIPTVIMESLTYRVPVIATNVSGIPEVIENGVTGLLIPEKKPMAIAKAVLIFLGNRKGAIEMAKRGRSKVLDHFHTEKNCQKILRMYQHHFTRFGQ